jgi:phage repressor protein C with HTH and peptisase S24 domain
MRQYYDGSIPVLDRAEVIARSLGVSLDWLATGEGPRLPAGFAEGQAGYDAGAGVAMVPRLDVAASAGSGALAETENALEYMGLQRSWLRAIGVNPDRARVLDVRGDSMEPTLRDGDLVIVDTSIDRVVDNAIYVVVHSGLVLVKRVHVRVGGGLVLISDNARYPSEEVPGERVDELKIAGRVMWFGRSM